VWGWGGGGGGRFFFTLEREQGLDDDTKILNRPPAADQANDLLNR